MTENDSNTQKWFEEALTNQREMGLFILKSLLLVNGGGLVLLLSLLSSLAETSAFVLAVDSLKLSAKFFVSGIVSALLLATVAYATALFSNPHSGVSEIPFVGSKWVEPAYFLLGFTSGGAFIGGVIAVLSGLAAT